MESPGEFPGQMGYSARNLWLMVGYYIEYKDDIILQPLAAEISFTHNIMIQSKCQSRPERQFYMIATKKYGWTKRVLEHQIENKTFEKYLLNQTNFDQALHTTQGLAFQHHPVSAFV
ncbi:MAG: DUF1016 N-terminal domain-containing protein [Bacteroidales bacterium]